ncbi:hypothetical protein DYY67_1367 [Candidatus Nitrosotalea sp. TS]|uniref:hypothetical protein n=1 Tax=Candidatus Nitrosotalea sp. TS TaxID=2341020 RepID=UPI00140A27E9|nr:hypothetical protein [Candidatus Nitrosotalea sp. TS]NHI03572.1 hypothetical protein [Candidatus Nitrosotalea sp. TS]
MPATIKEDLLAAVKNLKEEYKIADGGKKERPTLEKPVTASRKIDGISHAEVQSEENSVEVQSDALSNCQHQNTCK